MWKRVAVLVLVGLMVLVVAAPAVAEGPGQEHRRRYQYRYAFALVGTITAKGTDTIAVHVCRGNRLVRPYIGQELRIQVADATFRQWTPDGCVPIRFDDVEVGDTAGVRGRVADDVFVARGVTVDLPMECCGN